MARYLVTGAAGQIGSEVVKALAGPGREVLGLDRRSIDVTDRDQVLQAIGGWRPDVVVNAAAMTDVDRCETEPDLAWAANALAARHVAEGARRSGAHLVHLSTDYVFSGETSRPYVEWDRPDPHTVYGASKLGGEMEVLAQVPGAAIVRTAWVSGAVGTNVVKTVLSLAAEPGRRLRFVDDQHGNPTFAADLAAAVVGIATGRLPGTFHVTNGGVTSWFGLARAIMEAAGHDADRVEPISTADLDPPRPARRPAYSALDNAALRLAGLPQMDDYHEPLERLVKELHG